MSPRALVLCGLVPWLGGCPEPKPPVVAEAETDTGAPVLDPALAVVSVRAAQDGPDVVLTFEAAAQEPRTTRATVQWVTGDIAVPGDVLLGADGVGVLRQRIVAPCLTLGTREDVEVHVDGVTLPAPVSLAGLVYDHDLEVTPESVLVAVCGAGPNNVIATAGTYEVTTPLATLGILDYGPIAEVKGQATLALDGTYILAWSELLTNNQHWLMARPAPIEPRENP